MLLETLLPLGKVDPGLRAPEVALDLSSIGRTAKLLEEIGYDGMVVEETKDDPFVIMALAAQATTRLKLATSVAIAFPRSPTVTAMSAWTLQKLSGGRFTLGLGTQVKAHIERRFGLPWSPAGPWIREYVDAVRAVWDCWQNGTKLDVKGPHYNINLMVPLFNPGPIEHPRIPIQLAAVNPVMCQIEGEVADGLRPHPVCTPSYIAEVMLPAVRAGAAKSGRSLEQFQVCMKPLVATAATEEELAKKIVDVRARISFYASTPQYRAAFAHHGLGDLADELKLLSRAQRWEEMPRYITDDILHTFVTVGTYDQIAGRLLDRYSAVVTHCEFSIPVNGADDKDRLRDLAKTIQGQSVDKARKAIVGAPSKD
ncbi:MAG TPA: TIGR03617 family F420-dependent LLM class oxidoreductase [Reyranella sp.]|nr:TIGR03617 family F420-dependent LLM class oxidoreductase [Reyranella sp.]